MAHMLKRRRELNLLVGGGYRSGYGSGYGNSQNAVVRAVIALKPVTCLEQALRFLGQYQRLANLSRWPYITYIHHTFSMWKRSLRDAKTSLPMADIGSQGPGEFPVPRYSSSGQEEMPAPLDDHRCPMLSVTTKSSTTPRGLGSLGQWLKLPECMAHYARESHQKSSLGTFVHEDKTGAFEHANLLIVAPLAVCVVDGLDRPRAPRSPSAGMYRYASRMTGSDAVSAVTTASVGAA
ncbi:hypothetical protein BU15DRAFT_62749 [Melanogaster broomeanus]|nr:hypothetical protein BU15DRAFT_62749 [Melanogaster broomeanus]